MGRGHTTRSHRVAGAGAGAGAGGGVSSTETLNF